MKCRNSFKPPLQGHFNVWGPIPYDSLGLADVLLEQRYLDADSRSLAGFALYMDLAAALDEIANEAARRVQWQGRFASGE